MDVESTLAVDWWVLNGPKIAEGALRIVLTVLIAVVVRFLLRRLIDRLTRGSAEGRKPKLLRPLRERAPQAFGVLVSERREQRAKTIGSVLKSIVTFVVFGVAFLQVLTELDMDVTPILTSAGVLGVAIGFGAQNLVKDFLSGMFMMLEDQYGVGDVVDLGPATGTVESVGMRITTIRDTNGTVWYVRNGEILRVGNSSQGFAVAVVDLPLAYGANLASATEVLTSAVDGAVAEEPLEKDVIDKPQVLGVEKVTPEGITMRVTVKVRPGRQWAVQRALRAKLMPALEDAGISLKSS
ncbi:mechanosensitive ion channel family protein [Saccharothrix australiensis]|uniref:Small conductance mechanosensitive channel n=1 Tax=Saccharothrix australiensis TaxID=2072 RepID=A0A495VUG1_9PSEU|nr:mechanosensitive ion channel family protein [Saccharothrix australiensis]RKT53041.1 small conductance mechanosensitive channel [Saccharothrix australiensis]